MVRARGLGERGQWECPVGTEFQFYNMESVLVIGCTTL